MVQIPAGFEIEPPTSNVPKVPEGYEIEAPSKAGAPQIPAGIEIETQGAEPPASTVPSNDPSPVPSASTIPQTQPPGEGGFGTAFLRGIEQQRLGANAVMYMMGAGDDATFAQTLSERKLAQDALPKSAEQQVLDQELANISEDDWWGAAKTYVTNPLASLQTSVESLPSAAASGVGALAGGAAGSLAGPAVASIGAVAGSSLGSAASEYGSSFVDYLEKEGVNVRDPNAVRTALADANLVNEAHWYAAKRGGAIGLFDLVGGRLGGQIAKRFWNPGDSVGKKITGAGIGTGLDALTEGAGEATAQVITEGKIDAREVVAESLLSLPTSTLDMATGPLAEKAVSALQQRPASAGDVAALSDTIDGRSQGLAVPEGYEILGTESDEGTFAPTADAVRESVVEAPTFFSQVRDVVQSKGPKAASPEQWLATIKNHPWVRSEEIDFLDLPNWLKGRDGNVRKENLLSYLEDNDIQLEERISGGNALDNPTGFRPQYQDYTTPGPKSNYKELTLTYNPKEGDYNAPHFGGANANTNLLGHVRFDERLDREGKRTLFIEEIQSDWHQAGRQKGYGEKETSPEFQEAFNKYQDALGVAADTRAAADRLPLGSQERFDTLEAYRRADDNARTLWYDVQRMLPMEGSVPDAPFKSSWPELFIKRMMRYAADNGFDRIAWADGELNANRYPGLSDKAKGGLDEFYNKVIPSAAKRWAGRFQMPFGRTAINTGLETNVAPFWYEVGYMDVSPEAVTKIKQGLPLFSSNVDQNANVAEIRDPKGVIPAIRRSFEMAKELAKQMGIDVPIQFQIRNEGSTFGYIQRHGSGYLLSISPNIHNDAAHVYATVMHEFGHIIAFETFHKANSETKFAIQSAYDEWRRTQVTEDMSLRELLVRRSNFVAVMNDRADITQNIRLNQNPGGLDITYWAGFDEWFAEQTAKWATTTLRPMTIVDKFFSALGRQLRKWFQQFSEKFQLHFQPVDAVSKWLDSFIEGAGPLGEPIMRENDIEGRRQNADDLEAAGEGFRDMRPVPQTPEMAPVRGAVRRFFGGRAPPSVRGVMAAADHFNRAYKYMVGMPQLAQRNPHIRRLQLYKEDVALMNAEKQEIMNGARETLKAWQRLGGPQGDAVSAMIDAMANMEYLTPDEVKNKVTRWPTRSELNDLQQKYGVNQQGLQVVARIVTDFRQMLDRYRQVLLSEANKITDPVEQARRLGEIDSQITNMLQGPYFPAMRFGNLTLTVRDAAKNITHFETFEDEGTRQKAKREIEKFMVPGEEIFEGALEEGARPLMGMPPHLLDKINEKLALSPAQKDALDQLRFELAPAQSFKHRFQKKKRTAGYSLDFKRAYANYFFHGSNHLTRVKYVDQLREHIKSVHDSSKFMPTGTKRAQISNFMADHLRELMDPKPDFVALRSLAFIWHLSFDAAAAAVNLTQLPIMTYPYLASKFGDVKATASLMNASRKLSTFYKQSTLQNTQTTDEEMQALGEAVREGVISEALAPELAALSEGRNMTGLGGSEVQQLWTHFKELGASLFQLAEQANRRITFRAAWNLAKENPASPYIAEVIKTNERQYLSLRGKGWTHQNAAAFVVAKQMVESTQFVYGAHAQPRLFRGKMRSVLVFKSFIQNTLFALWNNPSAAMRSLVVMGAFGGLMGMPGAEDAEDIVKSIAYQFFGKDFSLEKEARKFLVDLTGDARYGDLALHGMAREGFGIPAVMAMLGVHEIPVFDQSRQVGLGQISPIDIGELFGPGTQSPSERIGAATQTASGAAISIPMNIYRAAVEAQLGSEDFKRWEIAMPGYLRAISRAWRYGHEGMERARDGSAIARYDVTDPKQMAEVIGVALGYTPVKQSRAWDKVIAEKEATAFWDIRRNMLLRQMDNAVRMQDTKLREDVLGYIKKFNNDLPEEAKAKRITRETIKRSLEQRARNRSLKEMGVPVQKSNRGIARAVDELYPSGDIVDERKVR